MLHWSAINWGFGQCSVDPAKSKMRILYCSISLSCIWQTAICSVVECCSYKCSAVQYGQWYMIIHLLSSAAKWIVAQHCIVYYSVATRAFQHSWCFSVYDSVAFSVKQQCSALFSAAPSVWQWCIQLWATGGVCCWPVGSAVGTGQDPQLVLTQIQILLLFKQLVTLSVCCWNSHVSCF